MGSAAADYQRERVAFFANNPAFVPAHVHGTNGYVNYACRCRKCQDAWAAEVMRLKHQRAARPIPEHVHGTENGYGNYKCRCEPCTKTWSEASRMRNWRRRERRKAV